MILCQDDDIDAFKGYGTAAGFRSFPTLTDAGKAIALIDNTGNLIDGIEYSSAWYRDDLKSDGGWTLELIDKRFPFSGEENWRASESSDGGTPGKVNSVTDDNPDHSFRGIDNVFPSDSCRILLKLTETVSDLSDRLSGIRIDDNEIKQLKATDVLLKEFEIIPAQPLKSGKIYLFSLDSGVKDFAGNPAEKNTFGFGIPFSPQNGEFQFNELLFNPYPDEPDFIEFVNCSRRVVDVADLKVASVNAETGDTSTAVCLSSENRCLLPDDFYVITTNRKKLAGRYFSSVEDKIFEIPDLPSMPDDKGHLILFNRKLEVIDEVRYSEQMQFPLLQDSEGISLEKIRPDNSSGEKSFWQSASESLGWGTPGAPNSIYSPEPEEVDNILLSSGKITPDNDGNEDFLVIDLRLKGTDNIVSVWVFDEIGTIVKRLTDNMLAGQKAPVVWDGTADDGKLVRTGIYILLIRAFDETGKVRYWKKVCTVIRK